MLKHWEMSDLYSVQVGPVAGKMLTELCCMICILERVWLYLKTTHLKISLNIKYDYFQ